MAFLPTLPGNWRILYWCLCLCVVAMVAALPLIYADISVSAEGITRPRAERTEIKPAISGIIDTLYYKEGAHIAGNAVLLSLRDSVTPERRISFHYQKAQCEDFVHDLSLITTEPDLNESILLKLRSPLYKQQLDRFFRQEAEMEAQLKKADKEVEMNSSLARDKVISPKEYFDIKNNQEKLQAGYKAFLGEQMSNWQQDLVKYRLELTQHREESHQLETEAGYHQIRTPVSGIVLGINTWYPGSFISANETICTISPDGDLLGECYISPNDIGMIRPGQRVYFQIYAFDYKYFGLLTGKVSSIDNDYTIVDGRPVFKTRCSFDSTQLRLKNGFAGKLKKGLTFHARFLAARRSLWYLLWDKLDDWLNPTAPGK